jgi:triphosphoribosyl-dephospho-CoA synthase
VQRGVTVQPAALEPASVAEAFQRTCRLDVEALKPGNVSLDSPGHGMQARDFIASAQASAPAIGAPGLSVGNRILAAIEATRRVVTCNTNLGIVLLAAPVAHAALEPGPLCPLRDRVRTVLAALTIEDAAQAYRAIVLASPGGLGAVERHDVHEPPRVTLLEAMREAAGRDRIAYQYASGYADVFDVGVPAARAALAGGQDVSAAMTAVYTAFLTRFPDSHIARKFGEETARAVREEAAQSLTRMPSLPAEAARQELVALDRALKSRALNPGTSADLAVASYFCMAVEDLLKTR